MNVQHKTAILAVLYAGHSLVQRSYAYADYIILGAFRFTHMCAFIYSIRDIYYK